MYRIALVVWIALALALSTACGGGGDPGLVESSDAGVYKLDVASTFTLHDLESAVSEDERDSLERANAQALRLQEDPLFGLELAADGAFVLRLGSEEEARGSWRRAGDEIQLSTTVFDGVSVDPPEASSATVLEPGRLRFVAGDVTLELLRS